MQIRLLMLAGTLCLVAAGSATAQDTAQSQSPASPQSPRAVGSVDFGARIFTVDGDEARAQRYRDLRSGPFLENLRYTRDHGTWLFQSQFDHVGYRDQRYQAEVNRFGALKASFEWDQVPLFYSIDTRTAYTSPSPGVLRLDDGLQRAASTAVVASEAQPFDLRTRRDTARFGMKATPAPTLDLTVNVSSYRRDGQMPWSGTFGFNNAVIVPAPLDQRSTDMNAAAEWGSERGSVRLQYDGSWFNNKVPSLTWDNPLVAVDTPTAGSSQGRTALSPDSNMNAVSLTGAARLPARSRAVAYVSVGRWNQDEDLLPFTINSALPVTPLARPSAEASANVTAVNLNFTSRPVDRAWLNLRYRRYDFDNRTPEFPVTTSVAYDQTLSSSLLGRTEPFGYVRTWFDADASYDVTRFAAVRVGYGLEDVTRSFRLTEETVEHTVRASIDSTGASIVSVRGLFEHSTRTGRGLDEEVLDHIGEQVSLRQFDISDRDRDRVSAIVQVMPIDILAINSIIGVGRDERPDAHFGLRHAQTRFFSLGASVVPSDMVSADLTWGFDRYTSLQRSRQANPGVQFEDPTRDWQTDALDRVHYVSANADIKANARTDVALGYDFNRSRSRYLYVLPANTTLATPQQLPPVLNELQRVTLDVRYTFARHLGAGVGYWFDKYTVDDFAFGTGTLTRLNMQGALLLGDVWRPYTAHTVWTRLTYFW